MLVSLLPGARATAALDALAKARDAISQVQQERNPTLIQNRYITWLHDAERSLRGHLHPADVEALLISRRSWLIQELPIHADPMIPVVQFETTRAQEALDDAHRMLEVATRHWSGAGAIVVPDCTVFCNSGPGQWIDKIEWPVPAGFSGERISIVLPMAVVDEMDNRKDKGHNADRDRMRVHLAVLDRLLGSDPTQPALMRDVDGRRITVEILFDPPGHVREPITDDEIVRRAADVQRYAPKAVLLLTYDTGQSTRGRAAGLQVEKWYLTADERAARKG